MRQPTSRLASLVAAALLVLVAARPGAAVPVPSGLPYMEVVLIAEVYDGAGWLALHQEVLATAAGSSKLLRVTLPARTGGSRAIDIEHPKFTVALVVAGSKPQVKVTMAGKISPSLALAQVTPFQQAAMEIQAGVVANEINLAYGLTSVAGRLLEVYFDRP